MVLVPLLRTSMSILKSHLLTHHQLDKLVGLAMLVAATVIFAYYTIWTLLMVNTPYLLNSFFFF